MERVTAMWIYYVLAALLLLIVLLSAFMFRKAFYRPAVQDMSRSGALEHSALFGYTPLLRPAIEWLKERPAEDVWIQSEDGAPLHGLWYAGKKKIAFVMFHGYASSPFNDFCLAARWAIQRGYSVLLADERGHGQSGGVCTTLGIAESMDCCLWAEKADARSDHAKIVLMGLGMGGTAALLSAGKGLPESVVAIVADSAYSSVKGQLEYTMKHRYNLRRFPLLPLFSLYARLFWKDGFDAPDILTVLKENRIPMFFAHGKLDLTVPYSECETLYAACAAEKRLFCGENAGHGACSLAETERYYSELQAFLRENLK